MKITQKHILFWDGIFSNFYPCYFENEDGEFFTSEQYFMYMKALYFNDVEIADKIYNEKLPGKCKKLGRQIKNFDKEEWLTVCEEVMEKAVYDKFNQNKRLLKELLDPKYNGKKFVEASPFDDIWGIKMGEENPDADNESKWCGLNLLGKVLNNVRIRLL